MSTAQNLYSIEWGDTVMKNLLSEFSNTAYGRRTNFNNITAMAEKCIYLNDKECVINPANLPMIKEIDVKPFTWHFLRITGKVNDQIWTNIQFGICDSEGRNLKNNHIKHESSFFVYKGGLGQEITIKGQDGDYYTRVYGFYSGNNTRMGFWINGTEGEVTLTDVRIFEYVNAVPTENITTVSPVSWCEDLSDCEKEFNLITDEKEFFASFNGFNEQVYYENTTLKLCADSKLGYCYIAWLPIDHAGIYTIVYDYTVKTAGNSEFGIIRQVPNGRRTWTPARKGNSSVCAEHVADMFAVPDGCKVGFLVYNKGGEIDFSNFKVFLSGNVKTPKEW